MPFAFPFAFLVPFGSRHHLAHRSLDWFVAIHLAPRILQIGLRQIVISLQNEILDKQGGEKMRVIIREMCCCFISCILGAFAAYLYFHYSLRPENTVVVQAQRYELTNIQGGVIAFWGTDKGQNTVLTFLSQPSKEPTKSVEESNLPILPKQPGSQYTRQNPNEAVSIGLLSTQIPFFDILGNDGKIRTLLTLEEKQMPILHMSDGLVESRLKLGFVSSDTPDIEHDDWGLLFEKPYIAGIGSSRNQYTKKMEGYYFSRSPSPWSRQ